MQYTIWVTYECNLKCTYCYEEKRNGYLSKEKAKDILDFIIKRSNIYQDNNISINIHGGEPLLNYDVLRYIVENIRSWNRNVFISMTTNAVLFNEENIDFILENIDEISVSIDGTKEIHDNNRIHSNGEGTFDKVVKNLNRILEKKKNTIARMTVTPKTVSSLYNSVTFLHNLGFSIISPVIDQYDTRWDENNMEILEQQLKMLSGYFAVQNESLKVGMLEQAKYRKKSKCCPGTQTMHIDTKGDIYPCAYVTGDEKFKLGDVYIGISEEAIIKINNINNKKFERCESCFWKDYCYGYRCKLFNYAISGDFEPNYTACKLEHVFLKIHKYYKVSGK